MENKITSKKCCVCGEIKDLLNFSPDKKMKLGRKSQCKDCIAIRSNAYKKTKLGLITSLYTHQKQCQKESKKKKVDYTKDEFSKWVISKEIFHNLYENWVNSNYNKSYIPSIDRIDDNLGYNFNNIQILTWRQNNKKGDLSIRHKLVENSGLLHGGHKACIRIDRITGDECEYISQQEASRVNNINQSKISLVCNGHRKTAGNYKWKFNK